MKYEQNKSLIKTKEYLKRHNSKILKSNTTSDIFTTFDSNFDFSDDDKAL